MVSAIAQEGVLTGTKPDPVSRPTGTDGGWMPLLQMLGAVIVVGGAVKYALPRWLRAKPKTTTGPKADLRLVESLPNGFGSYQIIEASGRRYLVAIQQSSTTLLADISERQDETFQEVLADRVAAVGARLDELISGPHG